MSASGKTIRDTAVVGDQIFTDIIAAKRCGVKEIAVRPISLGKYPVFPQVFSRDAVPPARKRRKEKNDDRD
jgi:predicted HAD superfamily phosphohydrolase YqeG